MMGNMPMMMNKMGMMRDMPMANMMGMMRTMGGGPVGMAMIDHVEGRIAFLRTELKITDAQASAWNAFADTLRTNAKKLGEVRALMMSQMAAGQQQAPTLAERLNLQEQWLAARLEGTRAIKSAFTSLYGVLSDDQKTTTIELLSPHRGGDDVNDGWADDAWANGSWPDGSRSDAAWTNADAAPSQRKPVIGRSGVTARLRCVSSASKTGTRTTSRCGMGES
jgi:hypothetical protein